MNLGPGLGGGDPWRRLRLAVAALGTLVAVGTAGYVVLTGAPVVDALFMTIITISTVGYGEVVPLVTPQAKLFTAGLIVMALLVTAWVVRSAAEAFFAERVWTIVGRQRMQRRIDALAGHVIVCGYGRMGQATVSELEAEGLVPVVIELSAAKADILRQRQILCVEGDATGDDALERAGIELARALIALTDSDATNVMTILSARTLSPRLSIVARAEHSEALDKLRRAGADYVLNHHGAGATHLALAVTHPAVVGVLDQLVPRQGALDLGQLTVTADSWMIGRSLGELQPLRVGALVLAVLRDGACRVPPSAAEPLEPGDVLVVAGNLGALGKLRAVAAGEGRLEDAGPRQA
ncbi:MAG: potassium channel family protein [Anaerolineae bacterium]